MSTGNSKTKTHEVAAAPHVVLGIRHHGPGSARMLVRALNFIKPDAVLIEGPPDAAEVLRFAAREEMKPPVALLVYEPDELRHSVYYPFATFSPEWQAIRWAAEHKAEARFIDLPCATRVNTRRRRAQQDTEGGDEDAAEPVPGADAPEARRARDPLDMLASAAGFADGEGWWSQLIEERRADEDPLGFFAAINEAMASARQELGNSENDPDEPAREAHMRRAIRGAIKEGFGRIVVVCGAWHAPVLTAEALGALPAKNDEEILKKLPKRKTLATWIPWTYDRLSFDSGYGAGVNSPGWYDHLWIHHDKLAEHWLTKVARLMREEDLDASPASVIESVRLAESLAALRGRSLAGLEELGEATLSILCHGNQLPMRVIHDKLIVGIRLGEVPEDAPSVPLQRDLAAQQKSLRFKVSADEMKLDLDQRKEIDLARSRLLHRLSILDIEWGVLAADQRQRASTFHEVWTLQWDPELSVKVLEAARWGSTVVEAAANFVKDRATRTTNLTDLTSMLDHVMLADLPNAVAQLIARIQSLSAVSSDVGHLMEALPPVARVLRYGNVRKTDAALVEPVVAGLLARICAGLLPATASLDDDAAERMGGRIDVLHNALVTLERADVLDDWRAELRKVGDANIHGLVAGRAWRLLLDTGAPVEEAAARFSLALSRGNDPANAAGWLEGFMGGSGLILVHDDRLLGIVDQWVTSLSKEAFDHVCPLARRTFSTFAKPERRQIGDKLRRANSPGQERMSAPTEDYDPQRGALVEPVLRLILGEGFA